MTKAAIEPGLDKTLLKGLRILELVSNQRESKSLREYAEILDLTRSNVHRTLKTLAYAGYVRLDPSTGHYISTLKAFELGAAQVLNLDARRLADPFMHQLRDETGEMVHLAVLDGMDVVYIAKLESARPVQSYTTVGGRAPAYAVATGKALLAFKDERYIEPSFPLTPFTDSTLATMENLESALETIRSQGYATNLGEWRSRVAGIAAPVFNGFGEATAALGISGSLENFTDERVIAMSDILKNIAHEFSKSLGYKTEYRNLAGGAF